VHPRAIYRTGHQSTKAGHLRDGQRYFTHAGLLSPGPESQPVLNPNYDYYTITGYFRGMDPHKYYRRTGHWGFIDAEKAFDDGMLTQDQYHHAADLSRRRLAKLGFASESIDDYEFLLPFNQDESLKRDASGELEAIWCTDALSAYASAARASQIPSQSEFVTNPDLDASVTSAYETGVKARAPWATLDLAVYWMDVRDEIVQTTDANNETTFQNAGQTRKRGVETSASFRLGGGLEAGASYAYADYRYVEFMERVPASGQPGTPGYRPERYADRAGNRLWYVPEHQYGVFASWRHASGLRLRAQANTWGRYWMDNANTATYPGYAFLTSLGAAWTFGRHEVVLDVENLFDERYAMQAQRDVTGTKDTFAAGTPRYVSLGYRLGL
jgi:hypothetical protein